MKKSLRYRKSRIAIFFSLGVGLNLWKEKGLLARNVMYFRRLLKEIDELYLFTYDVGDVSFFKEANIYVFPMKFRLPNVLYSLAMPFVYLDKLKKVSLFSTLQMNGAISALLAKTLLRRPLFLCCGYSWSRFARYDKESLLRIFLIDLIERVAFRKANAIIVTENTQAHYASRFKSSERIFVIPNSVDTQRFKPQLVQKLPKLVFIGRLIELKNLFSLIEAISHIEDIELDIIGSGNQERELKKFAQDLRAKVKFLGNLPNDIVAQELPKYRALVLPSFYEGDPKVAIEAMASGTPVIASCVPETKELIQHRVTGLLCGLKAKEIETTIRTLLKDEALAQTISKNARDYVLLHRDFHTNTTKQIRIIRSLLI